MLFINLLLSKSVTFHSINVIVKCLSCSPCSTTKLLTSYIIISINKVAVLKQVVVFRPGPESVGGQMEHLLMCTLLNEIFLAEG